MLWQTAISGGCCVAFFFFLDSSCLRINVATLTTTSGVVPAVADKSSRDHRFKLMAAGGYFRGALSASALHRRRLPLPIVVTVCDLSIFNEATCSYAVFAPISLFSPVGRPQGATVRLTRMGDETGKPYWRLLLFLVRSRFVHRASSFAILSCFVHAGVAFELGGHWREGLRGAEPRPKGVGSFRLTYDPQVCQSAAASRTNRRHCSVVARALVRAARALVLVLVSIFILFVPWVSACRFVSHTQASSSSSSSCRRCESSSTQRQRPRARGVVEACHHRSLESPGRILR